ncbi:hypothetical protein AB0K34_05310 [Actinomadura sp. NPDC049382]
MVATDDFEATFMLGRDDEPDSVENVDVEVTFSDGTRWGATFLTVREIERIMDRWRMSGEGQNGTVFRCPDLVIVRDGGVRAITAVLESAVSQDGRSDLLTYLGPPEV